MSDDSKDGRIRALEQENARLRGLLDQQGVPESLRHQVRNALSIFRTLVRRSTASSSSVAEYVAHLEGRIDAILRVQAQIMSSPKGGVDLRALIANELLAHVVREGEKATIAGPDIRVPARTAEYLGLALHELVTNAIKFGSLPLSTGRIAIAWRVDPGEGGLTLTWSEEGSNAPVPAPTARGFGMEALEAMLPYQLKAETRLDFRPEGLLCTIRLPPAAMRV